MSDRMGELGIGDGGDDEPVEREEKKSKKKKGQKGSSVPLVEVRVAGSEEKVVSLGDEAALFEPVRQGLETIKKQTATLRGLDVHTVDERSGKALTAAIEKAMKTATNTGQTVKGALDDIKASIQRGQKAGEKGMQARGNLYNASAKEFHGAMNEYNTVYASVRSRVSDNKRRQLRNALPESALTDEQIEAVIDSGKEQEVMQKAMMQEDLSDLQDIVADVEERHAQILRLEQSVLELLDLFKDLSILVDIQGEQITTISSNISSAVSNVAAGEKAIASAEKGQLAARRKKCYLIGCLVIVVVIVLIMGGFFGGAFGSG